MISPGSYTVLVVGDSCRVSVATYLSRAAIDRGLTVRHIDPSTAYISSSLIRGVCHRFFGDYPLWGYIFNDTLSQELIANKPRYLVTVGKTPVFPDTLALARRLGIGSAHFSTDDPWNRRTSATWFFKCLKNYDVVFTPRSATLDSFHAAGIRRVMYLPFAYCPYSHRFSHDVLEAPEHGDLFFAGGCDQDRIPFFVALVNAGLRPVLYGNYWHRNQRLRKFHHGQASLGEMSVLHARTPVSICLVRKANRDSHVMRTYEAPAMGACLVAEDTADHRRLFGDDGSRVLYFSDPTTLIAACKRALADNGLRNALREDARALITNGNNTYTSRLGVILAEADKSHGNGC